MTVGSKTKVNNHVTTTEYISIR